MISVSEAFDGDKEFVNILVEVKASGMKNLKFIETCDYTERSRTISKLKAKAYKQLEEFKDNVKQIKESDFNVEQLESGVYIFKVDLEKSNRIMIKDEAELTIVCGIAEDRTHNIINHRLDSFITCVEDVLDLLID